LINNDSSGQWDLTSLTCSHEPETDDTNCLQILSGTSASPPRPPLQPYRSLLQDLLPVQHLDHHLIHSKNPNLLLIDTRNNSSGIAVSSVALTEPESGSAPGPGPGPGHNSSPGRPALGGSHSFSSVVYANAGQNTPYMSSFKVGKAQRRRIRGV
jgi:hypothetical protein